MTSRQADSRGDRAVSPDGMLVRQRQPLNLEMPFSALDAWVTPVGRSFVRSHFAIPHLDLKTWVLKIEGEVERSYELSYDEIRQMVPRTITVTMECAGNGRAFLTPHASGAQWELGAVSNTEWTGVLLSEVLNRAGLKSCVREIVLEGGDQGEIVEASGPVGKVCYARSLPLRKACDDVLLALRMNGEPLTPSHGWPLRAIIPGWYGMASVKWLTRILASGQPFNGYYQTIDYAYWQRGPSTPMLVPISELQVKAQIARPGSGETVCAGQTYPVRGAAWTSEAEIMKVEISTNGGEAWHSTHLLGKPIRNAWRFWEYDWKVPTRRGKTTLMIRATDSEGRTQPTEHDRNRRSYMVNHILPIVVEVR